MLIFFLSWEKTKNAPRSASDHETGAHLSSRYHSCCRDILPCRSAAVTPRRGCTYPPCFGRSGHRLGSDGRSGLLAACSHLPHALCGRLPRAVFVVAFDLFSYRVSISYFYGFVNEFWGSYFLYYNIDNPPKSCYTGSNFFERITAMTVWAFMLHMNTTQQHGEHTSSGLYCRTLISI